MKKAAIYLISAIIVFSFHSCKKDDSATPNSKPKEYEGWELIWNDEFNDEIINPENWNYETGDGTDYGLPVGWGNNELQIYTNESENSSIVNDGDISVLAINALKKGDNEYTSTKLTSNQLFNIRFGRIEVRAKVPEGQGLLPAIWMLGVNRGEIDWPGCGEIDILEVLGQQPETMYSTLHFANSENKHDEIQQSLTLENGDFSNSYHTITLFWTPDTISFMVDDKNLSGPIYIEDDMKEFLRSFYLIMNVAVGGNWPGLPDATTAFPSTLYVDYVRVYKLIGFDEPTEPPLSIEEETTGQITADPSISINENFTILGNMEFLGYGPGQPNISESNTAVNGNTSLAWNFPGGEWGGAYFEMESAVDISSYSNLKFALNKSTDFVNAEIKLESPTTNAIVFLKDYTGTDADNGFKEYSIPLADFTGLNLSELTIPFAIWNAQNASGELIQTIVLVDNIRFE